MSRSNSKVEYQSMASTTTELTWITFLPHDIGINIDQPPQLLRNKKKK